MSKVPPRSLVSPTSVGTVPKDPQIDLLLKEIEGEEVPQRLLDLARKLQEALVVRKRAPGGNDPV